MSDFVNTYDVIGDDALVDSIIDCTITECASDEPKTIGQRAFVYRKMLEKVDFPSVKTIGEEAFLYCESLTEANFTSAEVVGRKAFSGLTKLANISFPSVIEIGGGAFTACAMERIDFPLLETVGSNSANSFGGCKNLKIINIPLLKAASGTMFQNCKSLTEINFPVLTEMGYSAFEGCTNLTTVDCPSLTKLDSRTFCNTGLISVDFPLVTTVGEYAFLDCASLKSVKLPKVSIIRYNTFGDCALLSDVYLPNVTTVETHSFWSCESLTNIDLPSVTSIGAAFVYCSNLKTLILRSNIMCTATTTGVCAHTLIEKGTGYIYVPAALVEQYKVASVWSTYATQFRALEDYTVDGTTAGALDETKI